MKVCDLSVCSYNKHINTINKLYEGINDINDAIILSQLAMSNKADNELIIIMPGWNLGIKNHKSLYNNALILAEKYKVD